MKKAAHSKQGVSVRRAALAGSIAALLSARAEGAAWAQTAAPPSQQPTTTPSTQKPKPAPKKPDPPDEVVIRLPKSVYQTLPGAVVGDIEPELELSPSDVQSYGVSTVTDLLDELAPQTRSDRGRGGDSPVILLNGRRISGFNEIRDIPVEAILRVDILPEEVSLKYGYTADQRVVNIVLRPRFRALTGEAAGGILHLINSGPATLDGTGQQSRNGQPAMKPFWEITEAEVKKCLAATTWHPSITEYFPGGGWSTRFLTRGGMPVTMCRLNLIKGLGPVLQIAEGHTVDLPEKVHDTLDQRTNPTWPTTWFAPILTGHGAFRDVYSVMNNWGANHGAISYGHIGADLISLAAMLRIPVYMHNVANDRIFRPSTWAAFGTQCLESADYRACANFGPLYA